MKSGTRISELALEQYVLGELGEAEAQAVKEAMALDPEVKARVSAIEASNRELQESLPPLDLGELGPEPAPRPGLRVYRPRSLAMGIPAGLAALFLVAFLVYPRLGPGYDTRMKGGSPHLLLFRQTAQGAERLEANAQAGAHDVLQLAYEAGGSGFGTIFSVDGRGALTFHLPPAGGATTSPSLDGKGAILLPAAYELDDAPAFERFFLVVSAKPFELGPVQKAAQDLARNPAAAQSGELKLPGGLRWVSFTIIKRRAP